MNAETIRVATADALRMYDDEVQPQGIIDDLMASHDMTHDEAKLILNVVVDMKRRLTQERWGSKAEIGMEAEAPKLAWVPEDYPGIFQ